MTSDPHDQPDEPHTRTEARTHVEADHADDNHVLDGDAEELYLRVEAAQLRVDLDKRLGLDTPAWIQVLAKNDQQY